MRLFLVVLFMFFTGCGLAQGERPAYKTMAATVEGLYNRSAYDSIYQLFSADMKKALPLAQTKAFFGGLKKDAGQLKLRRFERYQSSYAMYKASFERDTFSLALSLDAAFMINGFFVKPYVSAPVPARNSVALRLPFNDSWTVMWGGDTKEQNYHVEAPAQRAAFDFIITDTTGKSYKTNGKTATDYYAFGKELVAPCDGEVVLAVDGVKDNIPGQMNPLFVTGNTVILKIGPNEFLVFAHFKQHSIIVREGQKVARGDTLGLCGNSGNSSEPHLHFHIQNVEDLNVTTGVKCFFDTMTVNGIQKENYSPVKGDVIKHRE